MTRHRIDASRSGGDFAQGPAGGLAQRAGAMPSRAARLRAVS
ncbi:MAG TPA: hypothetical protein VGF31_01615 [Myxococcaceae bacterium]|jgi:hypothetical protein